MIQIKPYSELPDPKLALDIFLYNAAVALPFPGEFVFTDGAFWDGRTGEINPDIDEFNKRFNKLYDEKHLEDIRKMIFSYSSKLGSFLYSGKELKRDNLHTLLTSPMDEFTLQQNGIFEIIEEVDKTQPKTSKHLLDTVFRYDSLSSSRRKGNIYEYIKLLNVEVCPYCNRMFTSTVVKEEQQDKRIRPQLDHYWNKDNYPFLALSIMNLVPSCGVCNLTKGTDKRPVLYPYKEGLGKAFRFKTEPDAENPDMSYLTGSNTVFTVALCQASDEVPKDYAQRVKNSMEVFCLEKLYQHHTRFLSDLFLQRYIFTEEYCEELAVTFPEMFPSVEDVKGVLYLRSIRQSDWGERPLSKLVHDIDSEIGELQKSVFYKNKPICYAEADKIIPTSK